MFSHDDNGAPCIAIAMPVREFETTESAIAMAYWHLRYSAPMTHDVNEQFAGRLWEVLRSLDKARYPQAHHLYECAHCGANWEDIWSGEEPDLACEICGNNHNWPYESRPIALSPPPLPQVAGDFIVAHAEKSAGAVIEHVTLADTRLYLEAADARLLAAALLEHAAYVERREAQSAEQEVKS